MSDIFLSTIIFYIKNDAFFFANYGYTISEGGLFDKIFDLPNNNITYIIDNIYFFLIFILIDILLFFIGRYIFNKFKIKKEFRSIKVLAYVFRFIPVLSHIGSFLLGFNKLDKKLVIKHLIKGYVIYSVFMYGIFFITYYFASLSELITLASDINGIFTVYGSFIVGAIAILYLIFLFIRKRLGKK